MLKRERDTHTKTKTILWPDISQLERHRDDDTITLCDSFHVSYELSKYTTYAVLYRNIYILITRPISHV